MSKRKENKIKPLNLSVEEEIELALGTKLEAELDKIQRKIPTVKKHIKTEQAELQELRRLEWNLKRRLERHNQGYTGFRKMIAAG